MSILALSPLLTLTSFRSRYLFPLYQGPSFDWKSSYVYKAGRQQEINFRFTRLPRLFHSNFNDKKWFKKRRRKKGKKNYLVIQDAIRQGLQKLFPHVNKNLVDLPEYLPPVLANSRENNTNKSYINYFIKWQKWANQFPEVNATPAEKVYVILYMLSLFQNKKSYLSIRMSHYAIKYFKWKSDKMKDSYVCKDLESKLSVSRNLGL